MKEFIIDNGRKSRVYIPYFLNWKKILKNEKILGVRKVSFFKILQQDLQRSGLIFFKEW